MDNILDAYPQVSKVWLYFGIGDMLSSEAQVNQQHNVTVTGDNIVNGSVKSSPDGIATLIVTNAKLADTLQQQADQINHLLSILESKLQ